MTESEAQAWAATQLDKEAIDRLERLAAIVVSESKRQNLIARSTIASLWSRHIVDSLQLMAFARQGPWLDIGTGAGFPGLAIATADPTRAMILVEPRRLRADYLRAAAANLSLTNVTVLAAKIENVCESATVISARAVSRINALLASSAQCAHSETVWLLPKGQNAAEEVAEARRSWHGVFHVEQSITNPDSSIVAAHGVRRR